MSEHLSKQPGSEHQGMASRGPDMQPSTHPFDGARPGEPIDLTSTSMDTGEQVPMLQDTRDTVIDVRTHMDHESEHEESVRIKVAAKNIGQKLSSMVHLSDEDKKAMQQKTNSIIKLPKEHPVVAAGIGAAIAGGVLLKSRRD